jgi:RNA polymerase sigma-70 factor (ECF subfamily)
VRRHGHGPEEAQDLIQDFFARLLENTLLQVADEKRGRFRSFLLAALDHFLANARRRARAQKRGGGQMTLSLDFQVGEGRYQAEPAHELTAEKLYDRQWALTLIERAMTQLRRDLAEAGKLDQFEQLKPYLGGDDKKVPYRKLAESLGMSEGAVKVAVHRLRRRCQDVLRAEIAQTVSEPAEVEEELRSLFAAVQA